MIKIGITGGIGSGKSYVCRQLQALAHIPVYSCDEEARRLNVESPLIRESLIQWVGPQVYHSDGSLNRQELARYLFATPEHAQQINSLIHPVVKQDFLQWAERQDSPIVALEAALLFEAGYQDSLDYTLLVTAPLDLRIQRILERDHCTEQEARQRIARQSTAEEKLKLADFCLVNDGKKPLQEQLLPLLGFLRDKTL